MPRILILLLMSVIVISGASDSRAARKNVGPAKPAPLTNVRQLTIGLDKEAVIFLMRDAIVIGYKRSNAAEGAIEPIRISQPYKSEVLFTPDGNLDVLYYYTNVYKADGIISEEELTPLIFDDTGILIAVGGDELEKILRQNKIAF